MALDEPKSEDQVIDRGSYRFLLDSQVTTVLEQAGGVQIDYVDEPHQRGYLVKLGRSGAGCSGNGGNCSC
jgi:Fe-S cluster assembly iron-binding protein IscA